MIYMKTAHFISKIVDITENIENTSAIRELSPH